MMKKSRLYILVAFILVCLLPFTGKAQSNVLLEVDATVVDMGGEAINGAVVKASKSGKQAISDANGKFSVEAQVEDFLIVSAMGYETAYAEVNEGKLANNQVALVRWGTVAGDQEITVSNGSLKFDRITGSVERITGAELTDYPTHSIQEALAGRVSGLKSYYGAAAPTFESFGLTIRDNGLGVTYQDGVPMDVTETPEEIDNIVVAKDFGSAFMYGGSAASGALILNSKKGTPGEKRMDFKVRTGMRNPVFLPEMMDAQTYAESFNIALANDGQNPFYTPEQIAAYGDQTNPTRYPDNDYYKDLVDGTAKYRHITANFSGGNSTVNYFSHLGYYGTDGIESVGEGSNLTRLRLKNNVEVNLSEIGKLSLGIGGSFIKRTSPELREDALFSTIYNYPANALAYRVNDSLFAKSSDYSHNLLVDLAHGSHREDQRRDGYTRLAFDLDLGGITEGLTFSTAVNVYIYNNLTKRLDPVVDAAEPYWTQTAEGVDTLILRKITKAEPDRSWSKAGDRVDRNQYISAALNYDREFNEDHAVTANILYSQRSANGNTFYQEYKERNIGMRANYFMKQKYVLDMNLMNVGVRQLDEDERSSIFYSVGAGWLAHKESFLSDSEVIDYLKFRVNYGVIGMPMGTYFMDITQYTGSGAGTFGINGSTSSTGGYRRYYTGGSDYVFPKKASFNIGFDYQMLGSKLTGQVNYFKVRNTDQIDRGTGLYALLSGAEAYVPYINYSDNHSSGFDGRITYSDKAGDFTYSIDANAMYRTTYVTKAATYEYPELERNSIGNQGGRIVGLEADGIFQNQGEIDAHVPQMFGETKPGDIRYKDYNNDGFVDEKDYHEIGNTPRFYYGLNLRLGYKCFAFSVHADGRAFGDMIYNRNTNRGMNDYTAAMAQSWPVSNDLPRLSTYSVPNNTRTSTFWMRKAGYLNLRSINLSYTVSPKVLQGTLVKDAMIYVAAKNLMVLSGSDDMFMPNTNKGYYQYPVLNAMELGLQLSF